MERNCQICIHHISGLCSKWNCEMQTLEDYRNKVIDEFANWLYENHKTDLTEYIEWYKEEIAEQMKGE